MFISRTPVHENTLPPTAQSAYQDHVTINTENNQVYYITEQTDTSITSPTPTSIRLNRLLMQRHAAEQFFANQPALCEVNQNNDLATPSNINSMATATTSTNPWGNAQHRRAIWVRESRDLNKQV
jgi:hypothetical protein